MMLHCRQQSVLPMTHCSSQPQLNSTAPLQQSLIGIPVKALCHGAAPNGVGLGGVLDGQLVDTDAAPKAAPPAASSSANHTPPAAAAASAAGSSLAQASHSRRHCDGSGAAAAAAARDSRAAGELHGPDAFSARAAADATTAAAAAASGTAPLDWEPSGGSSLPRADASMDVHPPAVVAAPAPSATAADAPEPPAEFPVAEQPTAAEASGQGRRPRHYWGQALQHLDRAAQVEAGSRLTLLAKRDGGAVRFSLRVGTSLQHAHVKSCQAAAAAVWCSWDRSQLPRTRAKVLLTPGPLTMRNPLTAVHVSKTHAVA